MVSGGRKSPELSGVMRIPSYSQSSGGFFPGSEPKTYGQTHPYYT